MPIHIDEIDSEVVTDSDSMPSSAPPPESAQLAARVLERLARLAEDRRRVAAEGFDD